MNGLLKKKKPKMKKQSSHQTPQSILANQKLKKAKQHVAAQKVPKPKAGKVLFKTSSLTGSSTSAAILVKTPHKKPVGTVAVKKKKEKGGGQTLLGHAPSPLVAGVTAVTSEVPTAEREGEEQGKKGGGGEGEVPKPPPVLPSDLPEDISTSISQFEESVARDQASTPDGKMSVKTRSSYDEKLTELELACRKLHMKKRIAVLEYVSHKLGVSRATTIKRVRQVMKKREEEALARPLQKLREAVDASMPEQLQQYEQELRARAESLSSTGDKVSMTPMEIEDDITVDEVFEESSNAASEMKEVVAKAKRAPRKKYKWTEETRGLLCEVVRVKVVSEELMRGRTNGEEILMEFLESRVKPIWPKGWMQKSILYKMTESMHRHFTNPQSKKAPVTVPKKADKEKTTDQKRVEVTSSPQTAPLVTTKRLSQSRENSPRVSHPSPSTKSPNSHSPSHKETHPESIQWSVRSATNTSTGSPITIVRKTHTVASSGATAAASGGVSSSVEITPRMAQLLSSVASSQALLKTTKPTLPSKHSPVGSQSTKKSEKSGKITLHSDVEALLSQFQSSPVRFAELTGTRSPSTTTESSRIVSTSQSLSQAPLSSLGGRDTVVVGGHMGSSGAKLTSSKITTSPIQMKAIVSQLKPKPLSHSKPAQTSVPKPASPSSLSVANSQKKRASPPKPPSSSSSSSSSSSRGVLTSPAVVSKVRKSCVASSTGPTIQLPKITAAFSMAHTKSAQLASSQQGHPHISGTKHSKDVGHSKKGSPPKGEGFSKPHPPTTPTARRPDHSSVIQSQKNRICSPSPLTHSSPSPQSHLPLSAIVHQVPPSSAANRQQSVASIGTLEGTPITAILLQQQPAYVVSSQPQLTIQHSKPSVVDGGGSTMHSGTTPFSSCGSTFILTSPLSGGHFGHQHVPKATPPHQQHQTPPPRSLAISPPVGGALVPVGGVSGAGVVDQIYLEHSYGGQSAADHTHFERDGNLSSRNVQQ